MCVKRLCPWGFEHLTQSGPSACKEGFDSRIQGRSKDKCRFLSDFPLSNDRLKGGGTQTLNRFAYCLLSLQEALAKSQLLAAEPTSLHLCLPRICLSWMVSFRSVHYSNLLSQIVMKVFV